jgi:hypothetical protein
MNDPDQILRALLGRPTITVTDVEDCLARLVAMGADDTTIATATAMKVSYLAAARLRVHAASGQTQGDG